MRTADQIRTAMHAVPFRPFALKLVDGSVCMVEHPDFIAIPPRRPREVAFFVDAPEADGYETYWIDLGLILAVIVPAQPAATPPGQQEGRP
jgi:hypothetical protein